MTVKSVKLYDITTREAVEYQPNDVSDLLARCVDNLYDPTKNLHRADAVMMLYTYVEDGKEYIEYDSSTVLKKDLLWLLHCAIKHLMSDEG